MWLVSFASYFNVFFSKLRNKTPKFTPSAMKSIQMHRYISHRKATDELGYKPRPFEETIKDTLEWFRSAGMLEE
ncbi:hypothetical protein LCGC14_2723340, partial [marine sediment metagenome]